MKQIPITKLKQMTVEEIKNSGCFEITADSEPVAIVIVGAEQMMRNRIEVCAGQIDGMRGK